MYDLIIVGGGPAGMTAAVYAARKRTNALLLSKELGGQPMRTASIENYMGYQYVEGPELMHKFEEQVSHFPLERKIGEDAVRLSRRDGGFEVTTESGESYEARTVIIATGKRSRPLDVPGEERLRARGVSYCATCDGPLFSGEKVAVIGGGNSALSTADDMLKIASHVYLISNTPLTGDQILAEKIQSATNATVFVEHGVTEIMGANRVEGIKIKDLKSGSTKKLDVGGIFIEIGLVPNSNLVKDIVRLNDLGEIEITCSCETDIAGLFAAGDVTNAPAKQIIVAAGEGAKAALQAHRYLQGI